MGYYITGCIENPIIKRIMVLDAPQTVICSIKWTGARVVLAAI